MLLPSNIGKAMASGAAVYTSKLRSEHVVLFVGDDQDHHDSPVLDQVGVGDLQTRVTPNTMDPATCRSQVGMW
jgi:hypothetical protein